MFRKVLLVSLVSSGLVFYLIPRDCLAKTLDPFPFERGTNREKADKLYEYVTNMWPEDKIWPQMRVAMTNIADGDDTAAQASVDKLLTDFSQSQYLPVALHEIAKLYGHFQQYQKALELYQWVVDGWPEHEYTMWSRRDIARLNIEIENEAAAQAAIDKLLADFSANKYIALVVYEIAEHYRKLTKYDKAQQWYEYILTTWPDNWRVVLAYSGLALLHSAKGEEAAAQAVIDKLKNDYHDTYATARAIYQIAYEWEQGGSPETAKPLYQYVLDNWPSDSYAMWSQSRLAVFYIGEGNYAAARAETDSLIANYQLTERIEEGVYDIAHQYQKVQEYQKGKELYKYVVDTWPNWELVSWAQIGLARCHNELGENGAAEAVIDVLVAKLNTDFPAGSDLSDTAVFNYYHGASCYREAGKFQKSTACYQRIVDARPDHSYAWHAQYRIARNYEALYRAGEISKQEADSAMRAAYEKLVADYPDCPMAPYAQNWLNHLSDK